MSNKSAEVRIQAQLGSLSAELHVSGMSGVEGLSRLFDFDVELFFDHHASGEEAADVPLADAVGLTATLEINSNWLEEPRKIHGMVAEFEQLDRTVESTRFRARVVPRVEKLLHATDCRIFQEKDAKTIITEVLEAHGFRDGQDFDFRVSDAPPVREFCCQYQETDWAFVSRLLEEEGLFYFFDHADGKDLLVIGDAYAVHPPIPGTLALPYYDVNRGVSDQESIYDFRYSGRVRTGKVRLRDWDYQAAGGAAATVEAEKEGSDSATASLIAYHFPGGYREASPRGGNLAELRQQELASDRETGAGASNCLRMSAGFYFELEGSHRPENNGRYVITELVHHSELGQRDVQAAEEGLATDQRVTEYQNEFRCLKRETPFRPRRVTPKPLIHGVQMAMVVGPSGEEIYTDDRGRIKVKFPWDRSDDQEASSCFIRVGQLWGSANYGAMFIPRIGMEVIVAFENGDPDRPLVVGTVYHGTPPHALVANKTKSTIKTKSSPDGDGFNEFTFEDKKDSEQIYIHAQKDLKVDVLNDETRVVKHDQIETVENDVTVLVKHNRTEKVEADEVVEVVGNRTETIGGDETVSVTGNREETVEGNFTHAVQGDLSEAVEGNATYAITGDHATAIDGGATLEIGGDWGVTVSGAATQEITKELGIKAKEVMIEADTKITLKVGSNSIELSSSGITIKGSAVKIEASGELKMKGTGGAALEGAKIDVKASGPVTLKGAKVGAN